ncbi:uncharacterized protein LOC105436376 [Cucumis sativus]|uniref:Uncharacterized protein n=1 Tax=Cucumis sativus TaxID=3659 RepID=A0A0A0LQD5_CUCSA|nr:uncharacterized protein LOC105436376 [Cucumis sativus]KGN64115.1 hypothetical protein Csa_013822 [Cucumis sativus]
MDNFSEDRKRVHDELDDDSLADSAESKLRRLNSSDLRIGKPCTKEDFNVVQGSSAIAGDLNIDDLVESEEIQDELLLNILEDSDVVAERDESAIEGLELDSFIKSFEEEIQGVPSSVDDQNNNNETPQAELGYLFGASDDELGLPPSGGLSSTTEGKKMEAIDFMPPASSCSPDVFELEGKLGFDDDIPCYDSFELGMGIGSGAAVAEDNGLGGGEFVALGGLFDYSDVLFRPESLPAL